MILFIIIHIAGAVDISGLARKPKIAIIDIDVHHGNGTEAIIRNLSPHMEPLPLPSSWAPQYHLAYKPWYDESDAAETLFGSVHLYYDEHFYPGSGEDRVERYDSATNSGSNVVNIGLTPIGPVGPGDSKGRARLSNSQREQLSLQAGQELRAKVEKILIPALRDFEPTLLIISSGFDAHIDDMYHYLTEADFHWLTKQLCTCVSYVDRTPIYRDYVDVPGLAGGGSYICVL